MTPLKAIRARCVDCTGREKKAVRACDFADCPLHPLRMGRGSRSVLKPIRVYCLWCMSGHREEIRRCPSDGCPLFPFRFGRRAQIALSLRKIGATAGGLTEKDSEGCLVPFSAGVHADSSR